MKKIKTISMLVVTLVLVIVNNYLTTDKIFANSVDEYIRVGLINNFNLVDSVPISNKTIIVGYETNGQFMGSSQFSANTSFSINIVNEIYLKVENTYADFMQAKNDCPNYVKNNINAIPTLKEDNSYCIFIGPFKNIEEANAAKINYGTNVNVYLSNNYITVLMDGNEKVIIFQNEKSFSQAKAGNGEYIKIGERSYRGVIEFNRSNSGKIVPINVVLTEEYLYSVVPSEMPSKWPEEALKAQAVAARTYVANTIDKHSANNYNECDTIHCQVYTGITGEALTATNAVIATKGIMIYYEDKPINAVFFSSSGGQTENSENVWADSVPYLRSVKEINEIGAKQWARQISLNDLNAILLSKKETIGFATGISISKTSLSGRIDELIIKGTNGSKVLNKESIRTFFSSLVGGSLESKNFTISSGELISKNTLVWVDDNQSNTEIPLDKINVLNNAGMVINDLSSYSAGVRLLGADAASTIIYPTTNVVSSSGEDIIISGIGWGHGVGMSQFGAKGMAELGYTFDAILKHYYTSVEVR